MEYPKAVLKNRSKKESVIEIDESKLYEFSKGDITKMFSLDAQICVRGEGNFRNKAIWLRDEFEYTIARDDKGELILIITKP